MLTYHAIGDWPEGHVAMTAVPDGRLRIPEVDEMIERAWAAALAKPGMMRLFDGPICRLEAWHATTVCLSLSISRSSYKILLGTHIAHPELRDKYGRAVMGDPLGVSCALETSDGWLMLGKRNSSVAYYPERLHPFAGSMEPPNERTAPDVFTEARRELFEEVGIRAEEIEDVRCIGLVEDNVLRHPEVIMRVKTFRTRKQVEAGLDALEHHETAATATTQQDVENRLRDPLLTPVAVASLTLWGRRQFGEEWFYRIAGRHGK